MLPKIEYLFRKTALAKFIFARKRSTDARSKKKGKRGLPKLSFSFSLNRYKTIGLIFVSVFIVGVISYYTQLAKIKVEPYFPSDNEAESVYNLAKINFLVVGVENIDDYKYISFAALFETDLQLNKATVYIVPIKIESAVSDNFSIYSSLNTTAPNSQKLELLKDDISNLLGKRVDRYIAFDTSDLRELFNSENVSLRLEGFDEKKPSEIISYVFDTNSVSEKERAVRHEQFISSYIATQFSNVKLLNYFLRPGKYTDVFKTDMKSSDFITVIKELPELSMQYVHIGDRYEDPELDLIEPDFFYIDEKIQETISDIALIKEQASVEVYNASTTSGIAFQKKRELQNLGINVVKYGNYFNEEKKNILYIIEPERAEEFRTTINEIINNMKGELEIIYGEYEYNYTGDLILILGNVDSN